ncbi:MAG: hypothetical protein B7X97_05550 [Methylotenera sp. 17-45-7]|nr:MAG: hypothetical protein B7X97_05550 [Methylotenera sp. 17-45-7]
MPPDSPNEQELMLKKRARRRLVGAIALVLLMIIVLPQVLQDRAVLAQQDPIKITMTEPAITPQEQVVSVIANAPAVEPPQTQPVVENIAEPMPVPQANVEPEAKPVTNEVMTKPVANTLPTSKEVFTVQVGVYSDAANVKRIQEQLKQAGFSSKTEKLVTAKGEAIRLKAGSYNSRQDATLALAKIKEIGLPGIVVAQE